MLLILSVFNFHLLLLICPGIVITPHSPQLGRESDIEKLKYDRKEYVECDI